MRATVLDAITKRSGWIRSTKEVIEIRLEPLEIKGFESAQIQLCRYFNEKEIKALHRNKTFILHHDPKLRLTISPALVIQITIGSV